jgi:hypothetical protein
MIWVSEGFVQFGSPLELLRSISLCILTMDNIHWRSPFSGPPNESVVCFKAALHLNATAVLAATFETPCCCLLSAPVTQVFISDLVSCRYPEIISRCRC